MAQCPKCNGTGRVVSHLNPHDANKVGAGMGMHRCDRCAGQGIVHGASGSGGAQQLMAIVAGLFLHPVFSYVGFWLICTVLLLTLGDVIGASLGLDTNNLPGLYYLTVVAFPIALAVLLRKIVPTMMRWIFYILIGGIVAFLAAAIISVAIEKTTSG